MKVNNLKRDIATSIFFVLGIFGFMSGEFIFSTLFFGVASLSSNLDFGNQIEA